MKGPIRGAICCCFPGHISRKLDPRLGSRDSKQVVGGLGLDNSHAMDYPHSVHEETKVERDGVSGREAWGLELVASGGRACSFSLWAPSSVNCPHGQHFAIHPRMPQGHSQLGKEWVLGQRGLKSRQEAASVVHLFHQSVSGVPVLEVENSLAWPLGIQDTLHLASTAPGATLGPPWVRPGSGCDSRGVTSLSKMNPDLPFLWNYLGRSVWD